MGTCLFYYTGTGNSLWVARQLAAQLPDAELVSLNAKITVPAEIDSERIGIVTEKNLGLCEISPAGSKTGGHASPLVHR